MKRTWCVLLSILLALTGLVSIGVPTAFATGGTDGGITWDYNESTKTLTFSGSGAIPNYSTPDNRPWRSAKECETVVIQNGVTDVGMYAMYGFNALQTVSIANSVKTIGLCAFQNCSQLLSVSLGSHVTSIGSSAFSQCYKLSAVTGGSSVATIGSNAFYSCQSLQSITLSACLTAIGDYAFENCYKLQGLTLPASLKTIGKWAFFKNQNMQTVSIPDGVTNIGEQTFLGCTALQTVSIPKSVTAIGNYAFVNCTALTDVFFAGSEAEWNAVSKGEYVFGRYDGTYTDCPANEMPSFRFLTAGVNLTLSATVWKKGITNTGGAVTGSGTYEQGTQVTITAAPADGYVFDGWYSVHSVDGLTTKVYDSSIATVTLNANETLAALFLKATASDFALQISATEGGTASGGGMFHPGQTAYLSAKANSGWHFVGWFDGDTKLSGSANFGYTVTKNVTLIARFEIGAVPKAPKVILQNFTPSTKAYDYRSSVTFRADVENAREGGKIHWFVDGKDVHTGDTYTAANIKKGFVLQAKYFVDGQEIADAATDVEQVNVKTGFFSRLQAFFRALFGRLPKQTQEMLATHIIGQIRPV